MAELKDLRRYLAISRNRDRGWDRQLEKNSAERLIGVALRLAEASDGFELELLDDDGHRGRARVRQTHEPAQNPERSAANLVSQLGKLGGSIFRSRGVQLDLSQPWFVPMAVINALRRDAVAALEATRTAALRRLPRAAAVQPPSPYPEDTLSYLANVHNQRAAGFYARHGVQVIAAAYESHEDRGDVSLMITRHCVRYSLSLCPKQAKGVIGVQGTVRAEPLTLINGNERLTLRFDCKPCEMHVVGRLRKSVIRQTAASPLRFYRTRPTT